MSADTEIDQDSAATGPVPDAESKPAPAPEGTGRTADLEQEGDVAADYLEELLDIADLDGDLDMDVEGDRAAVSIVGAEEIYPLIGNIPSLARLLGVPYLPITPFFPLLGPLGMIPLPSKWIIEFGEPIRTDAYPEDAADDPMLVFNVTDQVRETIQQTLYSLLVDRGHPFF